MGIEPTGRTVNVRPNGFEDRGHHQVYKHFLRRCFGLMRFKEGLMRLIEFNSEPERVISNYKYSNVKVNGPI